MTLRQSSSRRPVSVVFGVVALSLTGLLLGACAGLSPTSPIDAASRAYRNNEKDKRFVLVYPRRSNSLRNRRQKMVDSGAQKTDVSRLEEKINGLDDEGYRIVKPWIDAGYWKAQPPRDKKLDEAVWLIVQHSIDTELKKKTLSEVEPLVRTGAFGGQEFGLMYDRVAVKEGRPQKYGSQVHCVDGKFELYALENPDNVNQYRKEMGFPQTLEEYTKIFLNMKC